jgi:hypothetical protein
MDKFSFLFGFYGLILGLAVAEVLSSLAGLARHHRLRDLYLPALLLSALVFLLICVTWIDAFDTLNDAPFNLQGLWAPIGTATCYFLAAAMALPRDKPDQDQLEAYYDRRKRFVILMLVAAEIFVTFSFFGRYSRSLEQRPAVFWLWHVPYKIVILTGFFLLLKARTRRSNLAALALLFAIFLVPYWSFGAIPDWIDRHFDAPVKQ